MFRTTNKLTRFGNFLPLLVTSIIFWFVSAKTRFNRGEGVKTHLLVNSRNAPLTIFESKKIGTLLDAVEFHSTFFIGIKSFRSEYFSELNKMNWIQIRVEKTDMFSFCFSRSKKIYQKFYEFDFQSNLKTNLHYLYSNVIFWSDRYCRSF